MKKFSGDYTPGPPLKGRGEEDWGGVEGKGKGGNGREEKGKESKGRERNYGPLNFYNPFTPPRPPKTLWTKLTFAIKLMREFILSRHNRAEAFGLMRMINSVFTSVTVAYCTRIYLWMLYCY